ncbi:hypothetical protein FSP39_003027 [Pinctada imbricata]|uniref:EGF-like domain-containing protein n=1 Tax=Pinctada imbricata TaxID=66713 RepID=A0AA88YHI7_PINIB|nr:hypothetical protein FSP39_003027 [Pinctada imbricata]
MKDVSVGAALDTALAFSYYCTNPGYPCLNGGTCQYNGECTCTSGFRGFNCGLDSSTIAATCTIECHNKGICYNGNQCYCTKDYMGPTCQQAYDYAECGATSVKLKAYRPIEFTGEIFTMESMFKCKLQHVQEVQPSIAGYKLYELDVPHESTGPCKLHKTIDKMTGEAHFAVNVSTVHRKGQFGMYDGLKTVSCHYGSRYIDDVLSINNPKFADYLSSIYPSELEVKETTETNNSASYLDIMLSYDTDGHMNTSLYDKRDDFNFSITNFPFLSSNIPSSPAYGVFISQLIRYARASTKYTDFVLRARRLSDKLLSQGYVCDRLTSSLRKFYGRYGELVIHYDVPLSRMVDDILS